jgi:chaperonin GroES
MLIQPLHDKVVVQRMEGKEEEVRGGIIIPDTAKEKPQRAKVIAVGKGKLMEGGKRRPMSVQPGDQILFSKWGGNEIKMEDQEYLILSEDEILAIID